MQLIIAADDDPTIRQLLRKIVEEVPGWAITTVPDGSALQAALDTVRPSLVLLDVRLPGISGVEVYRLLRQKEALREIPVLFVTANAELVYDARLAGRFAVLRKPFDVDALLTRCAALMGESPESRL